MRRRRIRFPRLRRLVENHESRLRQYYNKQHDVAYVFERRHSLPAPPVLTKASRNAREREMQC
jgi:hypothetical protein